MSFLKKLFYLSFGLLAFLFSAILFAWILFNLYSRSPDAHFLGSIGENPILQIVRILAGMSVCIIMGFVGTAWIHRSRIFPGLKELFGRLR